MSTDTIRALDLLEWNGVLPNLSITKTSDDESATPKFSVVADYGWAQRILCSGCYEQDAELIVVALQEAIETRDARGCYARREEVVAHG